MRRLVLLSALLAACVARAEAPFDGSEAFRLTDRFSRPERTDSILLDYLNSAFAGQTIADPCGLPSSADFGSPSFCIRGDATQVNTGGMTLSAVGSPTTQTMSWCGNGLNCGSVSRQVLSGSASYFQTASVAPPSGSFWGCFQGINEAPLSSGGTNDDLLTQDSATIRNWLLRVDRASGALKFCVNGASTCVTSSSGVIVGGADQSACFAFHYVGSGSVNTATIYVDGAQVGQSTTMPPPSGGAMNISVVHGADVSFTGRMRHAMFGTGDPSPTLFSRLAAATAPTPQGTRGEQLTFSRNSLASCTAPDGSVTWLQPGRPCVSGGLRVRPGVTNIVLDTEQAQTAWALSNTAPTTASVTADYTTAPDGSKTADRVLATTSGGNNLAYSLRQSVTLTANSAYEFSFYAKDNGGSTDAQYRVFCLFTASDIVASTSYLSQLNTSTYSRIKVSFTVPSGCTGSANVAVYYASNGTHANGTTDIDVWGSQVETGSIASDYCRSESTSATCAAETASVPMPSGASVKEGCARFCATVGWTGNYPLPGNGYFLDANTANTARLGYTTSGVSVARAFDGTNVSAVSGGFTAGAKSCFATRWSASGNSLHIDNTSGTAGSSVSTSGFPSFGASLLIGSNGAGGEQTGATISDIQLGASANACN